jgi:predicted SnoaL-like aldol condensation-catalyzing enzyme
MYSNADYIFRVMLPGCSPDIGKAALIEHLTQRVANMGKHGVPAVVFEIDDIVGLGDMVLARSSFKVTFPDGTIRERCNVDLFRQVDGEMKVYWNIATLK